MWHVAQWIVSDGSTQSIPREAGVLLPLQVWLQKMPGLLAVSVSGANYAATDHCQKAESWLYVPTDTVLIS